MPPKSNAMSIPPRGAPAHLPTLTEVIEDGPTEAVQAVPSMAVAMPRSPATAFDEALATQRVLADVQRQVDGMLEYRLRESLAPILARTSEALIRELRQELSRTLKDVVSRAVAQEVARQRSRS